jgi:DNA-binding CsgD family transcriptional regulator
MISAGLRDSDLPTMLRLAGEIGELPREGARRMNHFLDGLRPLLEARVAVWFFNLTTPDGQHRPQSVVDSGWTTPHEREVFMRYVSSDSSQHPMRPIVDHWRRGPTRRIPLVTAPQDHFTREQYHKSPFIQEVFRPTGLDGALIVLRHGEQADTYAGLAFYREWGDDRPFTARDRALVESMYTACFRMIEDGVISRPPLSPRATQVLHCLLEGDSVKQVAQRLGLSPHTVNDHIKCIYKRYNVTTRGELLARVLRA